MRDTSMRPLLMILTGASGAGKTSLVCRLAAQSPSNFKVLFFDSIGVPALEEMEATHGSGELWQRAMTLEWMQRIRPLLTRKPVLFEGQMRIAFIREALALATYPEDSWKIVLIDCDDATRTTRLCFDRDQPELANTNMTAWACSLRKEASEQGIEVLDTSGKSVDESLAELLHILQRENYANTDAKIEAWT